MNPRYAKNKVQLGMSSVNVPTDMWNAMNTELEEQRAEIARLRGIIDGLECDYTHHDADGHGERFTDCITNAGTRMCRICHAKQEAKE